MNPNNIPLGFCDGFDMYLPDKGYLLSEINTKCYSLSVLKTSECSTSEQHE